MHTTTRSATRPVVRPAVRLATALAISAAVAASLVPLPANALRSASCPASNSAAVAPAVADQASGGLLDMARTTLVVWTDVPDHAPVAPQDEPSSRQPVPGTSRPITAPLTLAEFEDRVSRYRRLPSTPAQTLAREQNDTGAGRQSDQLAENRACQP